MTIQLKVINRILLNNGWHTVSRTEHPTWSKSNRPNRLSVLLTFIEPESMFRLHYGKRPILEFKIGYTNGNVLTPEMLAYNQLKVLGLLGALNLSQFNRVMKILGYNDVKRVIPGTLIQLESVFLSRFGKKLKDLSDQVIMS